MNIIPSETMYTIEEAGQVMCIGYKYVTGNDDMLYTDGSIPYENNRAWTVELKTDLDSHFDLDDEETRFRVPTVEEANVFFERMKQHSSMNNNKPSRMQLNKFARALEAIQKTSSSVEELEEIINEQHQEEVLNDEEPVNSINNTPGTNDIRSREKTKTKRLEAGTIYSNKNDTSIISIVSYDEDLDAYQCNVLDIDKDTSSVVYYPEAILNSKMTKLPKIVNKLLAKIK